MGKEQERFRDIWVNQTTLGKSFNMSAVAIGKKLKELELRQANGAPTEKALTEGYCRSTPMKDGTPFFLWHKKKVKTLLQGNDLHSLSEQEIRCKELAESIIEAEQLLDEGQDKLGFMIRDSVYDDVKPGDIPLINRFLQEMGFSHQLEETINS